MKVKHLFSFLFLLMSSNLFAQQLNNLLSPKYQSQYIYPFADHQYLLELKYKLDTGERTTIEKNVVLSFIKKTGEKKTIIWRENALMQVKGDLRYEDYNNDRVKDLALFLTTGGRGSNEYYNLYLVNPRKHTLTKVSGFDEITNPSYHDKYKVILGYGYAGANYYSIYRINSNNKIYKIGQSFEDNDDLDLDREILKVLKKYAKQ